MLAQVGETRLCHFGCATVGNEVLYEFCVFIMVAGDIAGF